MSKLLIASLLLSAQAVFAADLTLCTSRLESAAKSCGEGSSAEHIFQDYKQPDACTDARSSDGRRQLVGSYNEEHAVVTLDAAELCKVSFAVVPSPVKESKVMGGRVIMRGADQRLYVVGRNGEVSELLNAKRESLKVEDFSIDGNVLEVKTTSGSFKWDENTITGKVNGNSRKARVLGLMR